MGHFAQLIKDDNSLPSDLRNTAGSFLTAYNAAIVAEGHTGSSTNGSSGLKIWMTENISKSGINETYYTDVNNYLIFSQTKWDEYLYAYEANINGNTPPEIANVNKFALENETISFIEADFSDAFTDADRADILQNIKIVSLPDNGNLQLNGENNLINQIIPISEISNIKFVPDNNWIGSTVFIYSAFDGYDYSSVNAVVLITVNASTSEINKKQEFIKPRIYPNPANGRLYIEFVSENKKIETIKILDMSGKELLKQKIKSTGKVELNLEKLAKGTYFIILQSSVKIFTEKFVVK